jgi:hypothetical protein
MHKYQTEDGVILSEGDRAYDYYSMEPGVIGKFAGNAPDPWFTFHHDNGKQLTLNGQRICTIEFARRRGFKGA